MNEIVNKFFLKVDTFIPEMHLRQPRLRYSACRPFTKKKKKKRKQKINDIFIKTNKIKLKLVFNMTWLMEILNI